ncbi:hypothetical protein C5E10_05240 [Pseudoclavibacter sp. RFBG4]|nr:hypothetical protein C5E10_05240 [Pseudoclavibacter sp. RFBG4]
MAVSIAVSTITDRIRRRVLLEGIDLGGDRARAADIAREEVRDTRRKRLARRCRWSTMRSRQRVRCWPG